jgi:hypothetical protein
MTSQCVRCGDDVEDRRYNIGYKTCLFCGEEEARLVEHTIVPMPKSNYIVVTDMSLLQGLNSSHKGGLK